MVGEGELNPRAPASYHDFTAVRVCGKAVARRSRQFDLLIPAQGGCIGIARVTTPAGLC